MLAAYALNVLLRVDVDTESSLCSLIIVPAGGEQQAHTQTLALNNDARPCRMVRSQLGNELSAATCCELL
jgi:hypothetical protein